MHQRFDVGTLGKAEKTPQGGLRVAAHLTRTGVFKYVTDSGKEVAEYRPPEEVFHPQSLASISDAPLTVGHAGMVSPDNHGALSAGHVRDVKQDGDKVAGTVVIQGRKAIKAVEAGMREVSLGYSCRTDETPGVAPDGTPYDRIQRDITINHLALVPRGRAGSDVRLRLDSADDQFPPTEKQMDEKKVVERVDGVEYDAGSDQLKHAQSLKQEISKQTARADAAEADKAKLAGEIAALKDPARLDAAVTARASLVDGARKVLGTDVKFDGQTDMQIKSAVVTKVYPALRLDEKDPSRTDALFEAAMFSVETVVKAERADQAAHGQLRSVIAPPTAPGGSDVMRKVREDQYADSKNAWKKPLTFTKKGS